MPLFRSKRPIPYTSVEIINKELKRLEKLGVIEKTDYSPWAAPTAYVKKKIRIYADYSAGLNDWLKEINYPLPTAEEIFTNLKGERIFFKLDFSKAYLQIPVEEKCAELLTHIEVFTKSIAFNTE